MISQELSGWLAEQQDDLSWRDQAQLVSIAVTSSSDVSFLKTAEPILNKIGPKGYSHGWVKAGEIGASDVKVNHDKTLSGTYTHQGTGAKLGTFRKTKDSRTNAGFVYSAKHADGTKLGDHPSQASAVRALIEHHNDVVGKSVDADVVKVGPKGYIHGWIKVGDAADSLGLHTDKSTGKLTPKRAALHDKIVKDTLAGHEAKDKPVATFLGGGPASGKSTVMKDVGDQLVVDPDAIKGKLPEYQKMVKNGDKRAAAFAHEESSHLAKVVMTEAAKKKLDFTLDGTGDSGIEKLTKKVAEARKNGHKIDAKYVTVDTDEAVRRAQKRAERTGRMVPETTIRATHAAVSRTFKAAIDNKLFDTAELWDNNGREPKLIGRKLEGGPWQVHDNAAWQKFLDKGQEA